MPTKMPSLKNQRTWFSYIESVHDQVADHERVQLQEFDSFFQVNGFKQNSFRHTTQFLYLLNYRTRRYMNMSENFAGYPAKSFTEGGLEHTFGILKKDDLRLLNEEIFPDRLLLLKQSPPAEHQRYIFTLSTEVRNKKGEYETYLQRNAFVSDPFGNPVYSIGSLTNISHLYQGQPVLQTIEKLGVDENQPIELIFRKTYFRNHEDKIFSKSEKRVLECIASGMSNKMIAEKLYLSEHTIVNHRRNMQAKANVPNSVALVTFALRHGLI